MNRTAVLAIALLWSIQTQESHAAVATNASFKQAKLANTVILDAMAVKNLRIQTVVAEEQTFHETIFALGTIEVRPGYSAVLSSRIPGRAVNVMAHHDHEVAKGEELVTVESRQPGDPPPTVTLSAPISGIVSEISVERGKPVSPDSSLLRIIDLSSVYGIARIPAAHASRVRTGLKTIVRVPGWPGVEWSTRLEHLGVVADAESGTIEAAFYIQNKDQRLRPGMRAEFSIVTGTREGVMSVPRSALQGDSIHRFVFVADDSIPHAIRDGAIMVTIVIFLFLLNFRTTLITLTAMPLSFAVTLVTFKWFGVTVNSMTLGGLAVAIGMVVDDAIVDVENVFRRLRENAGRSDPRPRLEVIASASAEVRNSILYATVLIVLVFLPLLGLTGLEGRLFGPIAIATIISMIASFVVSLTTIPVLCSFLLKPKAGVHGDGWLVRALKRALDGTLLRFALGQPLLWLGLVSLLLIASFLLYPRMAKDFLPRFTEETALIATTAAPGTSLEEMNKISDVIERLLLSIPEVQKAGRRLGRAERGDHVVPVSTAEFDVVFRPDSSRTRSRAAVLADIREKVRSVPGTFSIISGPLADRIGHMLSGVSAPVAIKIFGPDLDTIRKLGQDVQRVAQAIPGFEDCKLDQQSTIPQLRIEADRERAAAYGITPGALNETLSTLLGGRTVAELRQAHRVMDLVIRLPLEWRESPERIANLPIDVHGKDRPNFVPLSSVAHVREATGPNVIFRENNQRRFVLAIKPTADDVGALVEKLQADVAAAVPLPTGYFISYEGEFQAQREASLRIALLSAVVLVIIGLLLYGYFRTPFFAVQVLCDISLALIGGLIFTWIKLDNISIATLVGFIAVAGVAARNSIMLLSHYLHLMRHEGEGFTRQMVIRGTQERLVPVLMTALSAGIGLIPFVLSGDQPGKEILHPVAVVIVGGLITSTLLGLGVTPAVFYTFGRKAAARALANGAAAAQ
ncbi:MAG TPA: efflux RND transporter permease subunit [Chthoniobacteraceae bacterium]|nr:efflux RND transporter permease subunit [Chthoniobacteraceae bacterium]